MKRLRVNPRVHFFWRQGQLICDIADARRQIALRPESERLLRTFADWTPLDSLTATRDQALARQLLDAGILEEESDALPTAMDAAWDRLGMHARYFHHAVQTTGDSQFLSPADDSARLAERNAPLPSPFLSIPHARHIALHTPADDLSGQSLGDVFRRRRSTRAFSSQPLPEKTLSTLLRWAAGPIHTVEMPGFGQAVLKTSPSGGARHSIELYPVIRNVENVDAGVYHYDAQQHQLEVIRDKEVDRDELAHWCGTQDYFGDAAAVVFYTSALSRIAWKYEGGRAYRLAFMDLGHLSQTMYLTAAAMQCGAVFSSALRDTLVERALAVDDRDEIVLGATALGMPTAEERERQDRMLYGGPAGFSFLPKSLRR